MGVTIHFEGQLSCPTNYNKAIDITKQFCSANCLDYFLFEEENKILERVKDEEDWTYEGSTKGIRLQPDENCEPLTLEFDENLYLQEHCKTQFADITVHILIVDLLRQIESLFSCFTVDDESEYWETEDTGILQEHIDNCFVAIENIKNEDPTAEGPFKLESGRIIDLMQG